MNTTSDSQCDLKLISFFHTIQDAHLWTLTAINKTFNIDKQVQNFCMANIAFKGFLIPFTLVDAGIVWDHQLYIFQSLEVTIFFFIPQFPRVTSYFFTHRIKIFQTSIQTTKKWHSRPLWSYISTFLGSLLATYCVCCLEWPNNLLTILSFRFQAKTSSVIFCSLNSFPPMCEWYLLKLTITVFLQVLPSRLHLWLHS